MKLSRQLHLLCALIAIATGCNTCLDPSSIPFDDPASVVDMGTSDMVTDGGDEDPDAMTSDDMMAPDMSDDMDGCEPETDDEFCVRFGRVCGEVTEFDRCGDERNVTCDRCNPENSSCNEQRNACACQDGYELISDDRCVDVDECANETDDCAPNTNCTNLPGSFQCSTCPIGYLDVNGDGTECVDIDECSNGSADCDPLAGCTNTDGSFECGQCPNGYEDTNGDGSLCADVDECALSTDDCDANATCMNEPGSFSCACDAGWTGNGTTCTDIDECTDGTDNCDANATCANTPGSFTCDCNPGYDGTGQMCVPEGLVLQVETVTMSLGDLENDTEVPTTGTFDIAHTVPFVSATVGPFQGENFAYGLDVFMNATSTVRVERDSDGRAVDLVVTLVEFDPDAVDVQHGMFNANGNSDTEPLTTVDPARSFFHVNGAPQGAADIVAEAAFLTTLGPNQLNFSRTDGSGRIAGHYWVIETEAHFSTQTFSGSVGPGQTCQQATLPTAVTVDRSFVTWSYETDASTYYGAAIGCELLNATTVQCCRGFAINRTTTFAGSVVEFDAALAGTVERGEMTFTSGVTNETASLATSSGAFSSAILPTSTFPGSAPVDPSGIMSIRDVVFQIGYVQPTTIAAARSGQDGVASVYWQSIHWPHL